jgi:hypothetical protein
MFFHVNNNELSHELFLVLGFYLNLIYEVFQQPHHNPKFRKKKFYFFINIK